MSTEQDKINTKKGEVVIQTTRTGRFILRVPKEGSREIKVVASVTIPVKK